MKNSIKIIIVTLALTMVSCVAGTSSYAYNDPYSEGYSDGYRDGYFRSPDGYWYAPNVVYLDNNNNYYRNGAIYNSRNRLSNNLIISPKRNSLHNQNIRIQPNRTQRNSGMLQTDQQNTKTQPTRKTPNSIRTTPQQQTQPQREVRSGENSGRR